MGSVTCTTEESTLVDHLVKQLIEKTKVIVLYNDDVNTFDHVIDCLQEYCGHSVIQAEQCAMIVHYKGKTDIKNGTMDKLRPIYETLVQKGLSVKIE